MTKYPGSGDGNRAKTILLAIIVAIIFAGLYVSTRAADLPGKPIVEDRPNSPTNLRFEPR